MFFRQYACTRMPLSFMSPNMKDWRSRSQLKEALNFISTSYLLYAWFLFLNLILVNYFPQYDDVQNPWFNFTQNLWLNYADSYHI